MLETKVYAHLSTTTALSAVVSDRIYPVVMPQDVTLPCITYQRVAGVPINSLQGYSTLENVRLQVDCWGTTYKQTKELATSVHVAMGSATGYACTLELNQDLSEQLETGETIYRLMMDFSCWNRE